jgi:hypothetical protein
MGSASIPNLTNILWDLFKVPWLSLSGSLYCLYCLFVLILSVENVWCLPHGVGSAWPGGGGSVAWPVCSRTVCLQDCTAFCTFALLVLQGCTAFLHICTAVCKAILLVCTSVLLFAWLYWLSEQLCCFLQDSRAGLQDSTACLHMCTACPKDCTEHLQEHCLFVACVGNGRLCKGSASWEGDVKHIGGGEKERER